MFAAGRWTLAMMLSIGCFPMALPLRAQTPRAVVTGVTSLDNAVRPASHWAPWTTGMQISPDIPMPFTLEAETKRPPAVTSSFDPQAFCPDPSYDHIPYAANQQVQVYEGKWCNPVQRPWIELGRGLYRFGELPPGGPIPFGEKNLTLPHFLVYGDYRTAAAGLNLGANQESAVFAHRLNLDFDWKLTGTERIHAFWGPLDEDGRFTRVQFDPDDIRFVEEFDDEFDTLFFEGDLGYIWGGMTDQYAPFDLPFTAGKYPLLFQNGIWLVDAFEGFAFTLLSRNSPLLDLPNYDVTFFFSFDDLDSPAFRNNDNLAQAYGVNTFIDAYGGFFEIGYAYLDDTTGQGLEYHNVAAAFTRRYFERVSNSIRVIANAGQEPVVGVQTADGVVVLLENALVSHNPNFFIPYLNLFAGFGTPQSVARAAGTGGILVNTGINFETDGLTGFPTLDDTADNSYGGAMGLNFLGPDFSWQYVVELATVQTFGDPTFRRAVADQYALGMRWQIPLNQSWLVRWDTIYGFLEDAADISGARMEVRWKF
jgi:hypothetical protein